MAKRTIDPVLQHLVQAVNESKQAAVPVTISAHGMVVTGVLIAQDAYFTRLAEDSPLLSALEPKTGLLGKDYTKEVHAESGRHLHMRITDREERLWRISLAAVDGWTVGALPVTEQDKGPFARLLTV